jgi:endonuclease/exonuclease/phosphatase family metal-dependent hydrolase
MGDFNCDTNSLEMQWMHTRTNLYAPACSLGTFPSWRPLRQIDHILVSPSLEIEEIGVLNVPVSDHLPITMNVRLPPGIAMQRAAVLPAPAAASA